MACPGHSRISLLASSSTFFTLGIVLSTGHSSSLNPHPSEGRYHFYPNFTGEETERPEG